MAILKRVSLMVYEFIVYVGPPLMKRLWDMLTSAVSWLNQRSLKRLGQDAKIYIVLYSAGIIGSILIGLGFAVIIYYIIGGFF